MKQTAGDPVHPGEVLQEYLAAHGWSQAALARHTGMTPKTVSVICRGKGPITPATALRLERVLGRPARFWLALQSHYEEARARGSR